MRNNLECQSLLLLWILKLRTRNRISEKPLVRNIIFCYITDRQFSHWDDCISWILYSASFYHTFIMIIYHYFRFNPKTASGGGRKVDLIPPCGFSKKVYLLKRWSNLVFFMTFNITLRRIFPENFIEFPQVVQKILKIYLSILANFHQFSSIFWIFWHYLLTKKTNDVSL